MYPVLFEIPYLKIAVPTYGALLAFALFAGIRVGVGTAARYGLDRKACTRVALRGVIAGLVGAKVLMLFLAWDSWSVDWRLLFSIDFLKGGGVYYGGFLSALAISAWLTVRYKLPGWTVADAFACGIPLGQSIGRLACFAGGCCWGTPTTSWLGVRFTELAHDRTGVPIDVHLHPTQLYESASALGIFGLLMWLRFRRSFPGQVMVTYIFLYALTRFFLEFYRGDQPDWLGTFSGAQVLAAALVLASSITMIYRRRSAAYRKVWHCRHPLPLFY